MIWFCFRKWDQELLMSIRKHIPSFYQKCPQHFTAKLEPSNLVESELIRQLKELFKNEFDLSETETEFGLIGLHPCGDLAPILLKLYSSRKEAKFICIVGCCYMKLTIQFVYIVFISKWFLLKIIILYNTYS